MKRAGDFDWPESVTEKETGNAQPGACVDVLPRCLRKAISQGRAPGDEHVKIITLHVKTRSPLTKDGHVKMAA